MIRIAFIFCVVITTAQAGSFSATETWEVSSPSVAGNFGTIAVSHIYDGSPETGYQAAGGSYTANFDALITTHIGRVLVEPASFPDSSVFETRTITQTLEIIQWPAFVGPAITTDVFFDDGKFFFNTRIDAFSQSIVRRTLEGPLTTVIDDVVINGWRPRDPARTIVELDGTLTSDGWMNQTSIGPGTTTHDGVFIPSVFFESGMPLVPTPEPSGIVMALFTAFSVTMRRSVRS